MKEASSIHIDLGFYASRIQTRREDEDRVKEGKGVYRVKEGNEKEEIE